MARELKSPSNSGRRITNPVKSIALRGSPLFDFVIKKLENGIVWFIASASIIRGAPTIPPRADENVAARIPSVTIKLQLAFSTIIISLLLNSAGEAIIDNI